MNITYSACSHVGRVRENNEDNLYVDGIILLPETRDYPFSIEGCTSSPALFAVCDGMGGEEDGEFASLSVVTTLLNVDERIKHSDERIKHIGERINLTIQEKKEPQGQEDKYDAEDTEDMEDTKYMEDTETHQKNKYYQQVDNKAQKRNKEAHQKNKYYQQVDKYDKDDKEDQQEKLNEIIQSFADETNCIVNSKSGSFNKRIGTTLALAIVKEKGIYCYNIGDSRIYCLKKNKFSQITNDHTLAAETAANTAAKAATNAAAAMAAAMATDKAATEVFSGGKRAANAAVNAAAKTTTNAAAMAAVKATGKAATEMFSGGKRAANADDPTVKAKNKLTRCIGIGVPLPEHYPPIHGECRLLICSDGLTDMVEASVIEKVIRTSKRVTDAVNLLLEIALENGGRDNITAIVIDVRKRRNALFRKFKRRN